MTVVVYKNKMNLYLLSKENQEAINIFSKAWAKQDEKRK